MSYFLKHHWRPLLLGIVDAVLIAVLVAAIIYFREAVQMQSLAVPVAPSAPSSVSAASSSEVGIDSHLSLAPPTAVAPSNAPTPAAVPEGCVLSLDFSVTGGHANAAGTMDYELAAKNVGSRACTSASVSVYYAANETFVSSSPRASADGYYWQFGTLAPGQESDVTLVTDRTALSASEQDQGDATDEACLSADNGVDACANAGASSAAPTAGSASVASGSSQPATLAPQSGKELGVWVWTALDQMSTSTMQEIVDEAAANHFNAIYVTVDEYLTIAAVPDLATRVQELQDYEADASTFLGLAAAKGLSVDAEAGSPDWSEPANQWEPAKIMAFVAAYDVSHATKFRGVQYDIESYLLPTYAGDESGVLTDYVEMTDSLAAQAKAEGLPLTMVIPHFYDDIVQWTPPITVDGITAYTDNHLIRILGQLQDGRLIVMAYRNLAAGADGSIDLASEEIHDADATGVKVIVAQETGPVTPGYVTFYGQSLAALASQVALINQAFDPDPSFQGIAIDYLDPFLLLRGR